MFKWISKIAFVPVALFINQCGSFKVIEPKVLHHWNEVPASENTMKLDAHVKEYLRDQFSIESARYYLVPSRSPWGAISKMVKNEMTEKSIKKIEFEWFNLGYHQVDVYPQGRKGDGFALAMIKGKFPGNEHFIGYFVLRAPDTAK